jgi:hypothetical protein
MQRKLPERYRGHDGWLPKEDSEFKSKFVEQTIDSITVDDSVKSLRYDMETETHNYFANGILVHNCNARFAFRDERLWCGSRTQIKKENETSLWWFAAKNLGLAEKLSTVQNIVRKEVMAGSRFEVWYAEWYKVCWVRCL